MGEIQVQRDEGHHIIGLVARDVDPSTLVGATAMHHLRTVSTSLQEYLHIPVAYDAAGDAHLTVDRSDSHLDREVDAVLETLVIGLKLLEQQDPAGLMVTEASVGVEVSQA